MGQPVSNFLEEFPLPGADPSGLTPIIALRPKPTPVQKGGAGSQQSLVEAAYNDGVEFGCSQAKAEAVKQAAIQQAVYEKRIAEQRAMLVEEVAVRLQSSLREGLERARLGVANKVSEVLAVLLRTALQRRALDELAQELQSILAETMPASVSISGPEELINQVWARFCNLNTGPAAVPVPEVRFRSGATTEVTIGIDDARIDACLISWAARIEEAMR